MEKNIVKFFNRFGSGKIDRLTDILSRVLYLFIFWTVIVFAALVFEREKRIEMFLAFLVVTAAHFLISEGIIKHALTHIWGVRQRPYVAHPEEIFPIGRKFSDSSFPSSHMASTLAMLVVLTSYYPDAWTVSVAFAVLMAFARLHNGMHYLSDVVAGILLGIGYGELGVYLSKFLYNLMK